MENTSKALLIAAAVLVVIIIIAIGIKIYTSTSETQKVALDTGDTISSKTQDATDLATAEITGKKKGPIDYGKKTEETVSVKDVIKIGKEQFSVFTNNKSQKKITAIAFYNLKIKENGSFIDPYQSKSDYTEYTFSSSKFWSTSGNINPSSSTNINYFIKKYENTLKAARSRKCFCKSHI